MKNRRAPGVRTGSILASLPIGTPLPIGASLLIGVLPCACTLTSDAFEPELVASGGGEALVGDPAEPSAAADEDAVVSDACGSEGALGLGGDDPRCAGNLDLLPSEPAAAVDAGAVLEPSAALSLAPCEGEFGDFEAPERVTGLAFDGNVFGPSLSTDGRTLYFSAYVDGEQQIYAATREQRGAAFEDVREVPAINSAASDGSPFISADGERLYLFSERLGGLGGRDVWISERAGGSSEPLSTPELLPGINSPASELLPWLSADELSLIFVSNRGGGQGGSDLWVATRADRDDVFGPAANVTGLNSNENEGRAVLSADGLTAFFSSDRAGGRGGPDLWTATREARRQSFSSPRNLAALNSPANDQDVMLSSDGSELFFASSRGGSSALWRAERRCE